MSSMDFDAPHHRTDEGTDDQALEELRTASVATATQSPDVEPDEADVADTFELPGADLSDESLAVRVEPEQADEFTCHGCFLVRHHSQLVDADQALCLDCA